MPDTVHMTQNTETNKLQAWLSRGSLCRKTHAMREVRTKFFGSREEEIISYVFSSENPRKVHKGKKN